MTWLRHAPRHIHRTVFNHVRTQLTVLGWDDAAETPFGAPVLTMLDVPIMSSDQVAKQASAGKVFVTLGDEGDPDLEELGGPLAMQEIPIFFDVFMDKHAHAVAAASDIRDILLGRIGGKRHLPVINQATGVVVDGWTMELADVERVTPDQSLALHWQVVKVMAQTYFPEEVW